MAELADVEIDAALERGRKRLETEPRAVAVRYDVSSCRVIVDLTNGCSFSFPPRVVEGLGDAKDEELAEVEVLGAGFGLSWESRDVQVSLGGLMTGIFGTKAYMARRAGAVTSPAKAAAARANGAKGGRPRKNAAG
jgi:Protein of unknown function (DUF2442)